MLILCIDAFRNRCMYIDDIMVYAFSRPQENGRIRPKAVLFSKHEHLILRNIQYTFESGAVGAFSCFTNTSLSFQINIRILIHITYLPRSMLQTSTCLDPPLVPVQH